MSVQRTGDTLDLNLLNVIKHMRNNMNNIAIMNLLTKEKDVKRDKRGGGWRGRCVRRKHLEKKQPIALITVIKTDIVMVSNGKFGYERSHPERVWTKRSKCIPTMVVHRQTQ